MRHSKLRSAAMLMTALVSTLPLQAAQAADAIKMGAPVSLTGAFSDEGLKSLHGYQMCVDAIQAKGGISVGGVKRPLEMVQYDYQSDTNTAVQMIQRMVTVDGVDFLMAPYNSGATKTAAVAAERYDTPMIASAASAASVFDQHFKNLFGILFPPDFAADAEVSFYKANVPGLKTIAILSQNSLFPKALATVAKAKAAQAGIEAVYDGLYTAGALDFSSAITEIKAKGADWIYATGYIQDLALLRRQMSSMGLEAKVVTMNAAAAYPEFVRNLGPLADNITSSAWWHPSVNYADKFLFGSSAQYTADFIKKYTDTPSYLEAAATASCEVYAAAIEQAGTTNHAAVRDVLSKQRFETFYGPIKFNADGQNEVPAPVVLQIQGGDFKVLAPESVKTGTLAVGVK